MMMQHCILSWGDGKCGLTTQFFFLLLPARFLNLPDDGPQPGTTPLETRQPSLPDTRPTNIPETPGDGGRGRSRLRDHDHDRTRPRGGRTPDGERRKYRTGPTGEPEEDEGVEGGDNHRTLEDQLRFLLDKWETDLEQLRERLRHDLLAL
ncbi:E4 early protein [Bos taurus papillomavirus 39]|nr:E4 early protein [Bos taurus papillomavirus 39]QYI89572.1 E4 early protein [Bos taurus papillomavirus 39]